MLIYFQITILEKQLKSLTERIRLFNTLNSYQFDGLI